MVYVLASSRSRTFKRLVDLSKVATIDVFEGKEKTMLMLKSANDAVLGIIELKTTSKKKLAEVLQVLTYMLENSKDRRDARIFEITEDGELNDDFLGNTVEEGEENASSH